MNVPNRVQSRGFQGEFSDRRHFQIYSHAPVNKIRTCAAKVGQAIARRGSKTVAKESVQRPPPGHSPVGGRLSICYLDLTANQAPNQAVQMAISIHTRRKGETSNQFHPPFHTLYSTLIVYRPATDDARHPVSHAARSWFELGSRRSWRTL